mgnify:CR=1 FL=1
MRTAQEITDKVSIGLSLLCAAHCLALPFILVLLPSLTALQLEDEAFHVWMLIAVFPSSIYALTVGCKKHKRYRVLAFGVTGLTLLMLAVILGHEITGEYGEKVLTVLGASLIAAGHFANFRLCQQHKDCSCPEHQKATSS